MQPIRLYSTILSIALTGYCLLLSPMVQAVPLKCESIFEKPMAANLQITSQWRKTPGSFFSAVRANAPHNWAYFKTIQPQLTYLKDAFEIEGQGIGDFHILNIADIELSNGNRKIGLVDLDDGGRTSLFADFTRAAISNQTSPYMVPLRELWDSYLSGLLDHKSEKPKVIADILNKPHKEYLALQRDYIKKITRGQQFSDLAGLRSIREADELTQSIYAESINAFKIELKDAKILDEGFKIKDSGGSQGLPRYWFLILKNKKKSIVEFKTLSDPAMTFFQKQDSQEQRIEGLIEAYRPHRSSFGIYKFVSAGKYNFIARERQKSFLSLDPENTANSSESISDGKAVYLYLAQRAGTWHAEQGKGKAIYDALMENENLSFLEFENVVNNYIQLMKQENGL